MLEIFAIVGFFFSTVAAVVSVVVAMRVKKQVSDMQKVLSSKYQNLPPSPDEEDPEGSSVPAAKLDADEKDH